MFTGLTKHIQRFLSNHKSKSMKTDLYLSDGKQAMLFFQREKASF